jgi:hypothetical protein
MRWKKKSLESSNLHDLLLECRYWCSQNCFGSHQSKQGPKIMHLLIVGLKTGVPADLHLGQPDVVYNVSVQ